MNAIAQFDTGPLSWVKGEIDQALERAREQFEQFASNPEHTGQLKYCLTHLHQVTGAVQMVGLDGLARFSEELENTISAIEKQQIAPAPDIINLVQRAIPTFMRFLDGLIKGEPNHPLKLFPIYEEMLRVQGVEQVAQSELFFPDLNVKLPSINTSGMLSDAELTKLAKKQRSYFQRGLLQWLRDPSNTQARQTMLNALTAIEKTQAAPSHRAFWWSAVGFVESLLHDGLPAEFNTKKLCARIDLQIRRLAEGSSKVAERLFRDVLYMVARSQPVTSQVAEIKRSYQLEHYLPPVEISGLSDYDLTQLQPVLRELRETLSMAKEEWVKYTSGSSEGLYRFREDLERMQKNISTLGNEPLQELIEVVRGITASLPTNFGESREEVGIEMATALLLVENILENFANPSPEIVKQVGLMAGRLRAAVGGQTRDADMSALPLLDEISRKAQERLLLAQVVREIQTNLSQIEQVLDAYFRDINKRDELPGLQIFLRQVLGALNILRLDSAARLLNACQDMINKFSQPDYTPEHSELELLAEALSSLGFYVEAVEHSTPDREQLIAPVLKQLCPQPEAQVSEEIVPQKQSSVESEIVDQKQQLQKLFSEWKGQPKDKQIKTRLLQLLDAVKHDADLVADKSLAENSSQAIALLNKSKADADTIAKLEQIINGMTASKVAAVVPSEQAARLVTASARAIDAELLEVYLEEAHEVLGVISEYLVICRAQPHNRDALTIIRRGFHTLKGSGRMVGLTDLGEVAWGMEQLLNKWLQDEKSVTPPLLEIISFAHSSFSDWVAKLREVGTVEVDAQELLSRAEQMRLGKEDPIIMTPDVQQVSEPVLEPQPVSENEKVETELSVVPEPAKTEVHIGDITISSALYEIFVNEAQQHLTVLHKNYPLLQQQHNTPSEEFLRAVHTLGGISGTSGFGQIADLAFGLEEYLEGLRERATHNQNEIDMVGEAIDSLETMVNAVIQKRVPENFEEVLLRLRSGLQSGKPRLASEVEQEMPLEKKNEQTPVVPEVIPITPKIVSKSKTKQNSIETASAQTQNSPASGAALESKKTTLQPRSISDDIDYQLLPIFLEEAQELVPLVGKDLRNWKSKRSDKKAPLSLRRSLHTLKGAARMAGAMRLGELIHNMESQVIVAIEKGQTDKFDFSELESQFDRVGEAVEALQQGKPFPEPVPTSAEETQAAVAHAQSMIETAAAISAAMPLRAEVDLVSPKSLLRVRADVVDRLVNEAGEVSIARARIEGEIRTFKQSILELSDSVSRMRNHLREVEIQAETQLQSRLPHMSEGSEAFDPLEFDRFTRFQEVTRLMAESLHDIITVQQGLLKNIDETDAALLQQSRMTKELQQNLMSIRTVPFASLAERLYRIVRQTAKEIGKKANLEIRGATVELDRGVLEKIGAPLEHILRNAIAHGLETVERRAKTKKPEFGEITVDVRQEANEIVISISDDGLGLDFPAIRKRAHETGLLMPQDEPTDAHLIEFIFAPGFTTATEVTQVSGRGIGMDVVRNEIAALGGRVEVTTKPEHGTTFVIYLPLTLAVTQVVLVRASTKTYAIPSTMVEQVHELKAPELEMLYKNDHIEWKGNQYPFYYLPRLLGDATSLAEAARYNSVVLLKSGAQRAAVHVDHMAGNHEIVVKNIGPQLARVSGIAGATILGTGEVVLILNPVQLAHREALQMMNVTRTGVTRPEEKVISAPLIMVVDDSLTVRKITGRLLSREGYQVATAKDGVDALQQLQEIAPSVMLVDIEMPRMDGFDLTKNVRSDPRTAHIPIIMITSRTADKHRNHAMQLGVNIFLGKPYQEEELLNHIEGFVKTPQTIH